MHARRTHLDTLKDGYCYQKRDRNAHMRILPRSLSSHWKLLDSIDIELLIAIGI